MLHYGSSEFHQRYSIVPVNPEGITWSGRRSKLVVGWVGCVMRWARCGGCAEHSLHWACVCGWSGLATQASYVARREHSAVSKGIQESCLAENVYSDLLKRFKDSAALLIPLNLAPVQKCLPCRLQWSIVSEPAWNRETLASVTT